MTYGQGVISTMQENKAEEGDKVRRAMILDKHNPGEPLEEVILAQRPK